MSEHKSERLKKVAEKNNWKAAIKPDLDQFEVSGDVDDIIWELYCIRQDETIKAVWKGDRFQESTYSYGEYRRYPARSGGVIRLLEGKPDPKKFGGTSSQRNPAATYEELVRQRNVPWDDVENVPAFDVLVSVVGKDITWVRKNQFIDGGIEIKTQSCPKESNLRKSHFRLKTTSAGKRVLEWGNSFGFQACYLADIIDVT